MNKDRPDPCCTVCHTAKGPFERHHIALRANAENATVSLCLPCHVEQTDRQRRASLINSAPIVGGDEPQAMWALAEGACGILTAGARLRGDEQHARWIEQSRRAMLRLLARISDRQPGTLGPRPISNNRRRGVKRASRTAANRTPGTAASLKALLDLSAAIDTALPAGAGSIASVSSLRVLITPAAGRRLARNLTALESHPRLQELLTPVEQTRDLLFVDFPGVFATTAASDTLGELDEINLDELARHACDLHAHADRWIELVVALATSNRTADACAALERFLDQQPGAAPTDDTPRLTP